MLRREPYSNRIGPNAEKTIGDFVADEGESVEELASRSRIKKELKEILSQALSLREEGVLSFVLDLKMDGIEL
ncbi:MAG: hypothetical protein US48_C0018G0011 [Candidatus Levybacteria bacterium GW2011_GWA2_37_36]|nr:MAG: hypothetical protein US43_C0001G0053 [Candidatus Levybacteria bacterium GW2011_GWA1_37_16]KKQ33092.1 MAG: hypothetical protein US48_C0018G0011 [Candidatus Levybacteria bacterium GW2011_GWA2_37_36]KKQ42160.1 MAG: hypothetical protein US59_C0014G0020 [Candidatus Levybacteria bacterium GW2011_GWB1_37_8]OGH49836.1 MAG: hypothetical protein A3H17_00575 [Candidatus Levybacteria bacterium RIFCSPLOWO2_12_FULL_37_14]